MQADIALEEALVAQIKTWTDVETGHEVVDEVLSALIRLQEQDQVRDLRGRLRWEGDLAALRVGS